ncbi:general substrate transporter [Atractiella rhizophila]|nr:general substrate transporter [Atractiella rhizophila]
MPRLPAFLKSEREITERENSIISSAAFQYGFDFGLIGGFQGIYLDIALGSLLTIALAMPGFRRAVKVFGYEDPKSLTGWNIKSDVQQLIASLMTLGLFSPSFRRSSLTGSKGAFIGSLLAGPMSKWLDRRKSIAVAIVVCSVAIAIQIGTTAVGVLYFARFLLGIANGVIMVNVQLFLQEIAPPHLRGTMFAFFQFYVSFGSLVATIVDNYTAKISSRLSYQIPLALLFIVPVILAITLPFIADSPRWAISHGKEELALKYLRRLRGSGYPETLVAEEFNEIKAGWLAEKDLDDQKVDILDMFRGTNLRRTVLSVCAVTLQAASGAMFLLSYGVYFFQIRPTDPFEDGIIIAVIGLVSVLMISYLVRIFSRRAIILVATFMQAITMLVIAIIYTVAPTSKSALKALTGVLCIYIFFYAGFLGPVAWVLGGEIPSTRLRSHTLGLAAAVGFFGGWLASFTLILKEVHPTLSILASDLNWGPKYGYIWFGSNIIAFIWVYFYLPETKDRTLEEIDEMFQAKVPARKFSAYVCVASEQAREDGIKKLELSGNAEHLEHAPSDLSEKDAVSEKSGSDA